MIAFVDWETYLEALFFRAFDLTKAEGIFQMGERVRHTETAVCLRIFIGEDDKYKGRPLYEEIVVQAQASHLSGATVFHGYLGYGNASGLNPGKILRSSKDLPVVIEILDSEGKVTAFLDILDQLLIGGVETMEKLQILRYNKMAKGAK